MNWKPINSNYPHNYNFRWKDTSRGIDFNNSSVVSFSLNKQVVNHFENHSCITNKQNMFINLMRYCERKGLDVFKYLPFTVVLNYDSKDFSYHFESFKEIYKNINSLLLDFNTNLIEEILMPIRKGSTGNKKNSLFSKSSYLSNQFKKYSQKFNSHITYPEKEKIGSKTFCYIVNTHYDNRNMWIVKAVNLNRGRGLKVCTGIEEILSYIVKLNSGISKFADSLKCNEKISNSNSNAEEEYNSSNNKVSFSENRESCFLQSDKINKNSKQDRNSSLNFNQNSGNFGIKDNNLAEIKNLDENLLKNKVKLAPLIINPKETSNKLMSNSIYVNKSYTSKEEKFKITSDFNFLKPISSYENELNKSSNKSPSKYDPKYYNQAVSSLNKQIYRSSTTLIQKYIEKPLLYYGRKFDIRIWVLLTQNSDLFAFKEGHLKATSQPYDIYNTDPFIHLTNYSVQKYNEMFSYYEKGNEISYELFQVS